MTRLLVALAGLALAGCGGGATSTGDGGDAGPDGAAEGGPDGAAESGPDGACADGSGGVTIACPGDQTAACAGPRTPFDVPAPAVDERCGSFSGTVTNDAPADGFPPGETAVTFTATDETGATATCTTRVAVVDDVAPVLSCPADAVVVRTDEAAEAAAPALTADDACQGAIAAEPTPATLPRGTTTVDYAATDDAGNRATCSTSMTVLDAFAPRWPRVASARLGTDGSTSIVVAWDPSTGADATGYRVERAAAPDGPWAALGDVGAGVLVFADPALPDTADWYRVATLAGDLEGGATPPVRALAIAADRYRLDGQTVPTVPFATTLYGVVRHPVDWSYGPYPPILLLHGNHGNCRPRWGDDVCMTTNDQDCHRTGYTTTPNAEGMLYLAETLAAHGYVATTIGANALNCRDDYIPERTELLIEHLRRWLAWATTGGDPFGTTYAGHVDMTRVGLVGHSRGAEAVALVPSRMTSEPVAGVTIGSVWSTAPTDYHGSSTAGTPWAVLVPGCDGDVPLGHGISIYDRSLQPAGQPHSQVFFIGANHNYFSTEWTYDDNLYSRTCRTADEIGATAQRGMLEATMAAWFDGTLVPGGDLEPFLRADGDAPLGIQAWAGTGLDLRWSHAAAARTEIDDLSGAGAPAVNLLGLPNTFSGYTTAGACSGNGCDAGFDHPADALLLSWDGATPVASWDLGGLDAASAAALSFRVVSRSSTLNTGITEQSFLVRLVDAAGTAVELPVSDVRRIPHLYTSQDVKEILQTVRVPLATVAASAPGFELDALDRFELEMTVPDHTRGSVLVTDLELAGH